MFAKKNGEFPDDLMTENYIYSTVIPYIFANSYSPNMIAYYGTLTCSNFKIDDMYLPWDKFEGKGAKKRRSRFDFDTSKFIGVITERSSGKGVSLFDWMDDLGNLSEFDTIAIQIIYTCAMMDQIGLVHNDLHAGNLFVDDLGDKGRVTMAFCIDGENVIWIHTRYIVKIFDWDRAVKVETQYSPASVIKPKSNVSHTGPKPWLSKDGFSVPNLDHLVPGANMSRIALALDELMKESSVLKLNRVFKAYADYIINAYSSEFYAKANERYFAYGLWNPPNKGNVFVRPMMDSLYGLKALGSRKELITNHFFFTVDPRIVRNARNCRRNLYALPSAQFEAGVTPLKATPPRALFEQRRASGKSSEQRRVSSGSRRLSSK
jgi:hypothetical protein